MRVNSFQSLGVKTEKALSPMREKIKTEQDEKDESECTVKIEGRTLEVVSEFLYLDVMIKNGGGKKG